MGLCWEGKSNVIVVKKMFQRNNGFHFHCHLSCGRKIIATFCVHFTMPGYQFTVFGDQPFCWCEVLELFLFAKPNIYKFSNPSFSIL